MKSTKLLCPMKTGFYYPTNRRNKLTAYDESFAGCEGKCSFILHKNNTTLGKNDQMVYNNGTCICMFVT